MERKLSVILVEDDVATCKEFIGLIDEIEDIQLINVTNSSSKAIEYVKDYMPDVVILDLELHNGSGNGLLFLSDLQKLSLEFSPYILVTTNNSSAITYDSARKMGADFIMSKHQEDYSVEKAVNFLLMMKSLIQGRKQNTDNSSAMETPYEKERRLTRRICAELDHVSISPKAIGYKYLVDAIEIFIESPVSNVCVDIGKKYNKTESSVERAMQNAINRAWASADINDLLAYYTAKVNSKKGVPTLTEFICYYANKIKNDF